MNQQKIKPMTGKERYEQDKKRKEELEQARKLWIESESTLSILRTPKGTEKPITDEEIVEWSKQL